MEDFVYNKTFFRWALGLMFAFPTLIIVLNEIIIRQQREQQPLVETFRILRNLLVPNLAILLLLTKVLEIEENNPLIRVLTTLLWIFISHSFLSALKILVFEQANINSWQSKVPELFLDLIRFFLVSCITALILSSVWQIDLRGVITALGVGSLVIGLGIQDTLKNLFSGILILFERPFSIGDWLQVNDTIGKVISMNWRSVYLETRTLEIVIIPNAVLVQQQFTNFNPPNQVYYEYFYIGFSYDNPPNKVKRVLLDILTSSEEVLSYPSPWVRIFDYGDSSINYQVAIPLNNYEDMPPIRDKIINRIWYAAKRHNLNIPYPIHTQYHVDVSKLPPQDYKAQICEVMRSLPNFGALASKMITETNETIQIENYAKDERIFSEEESLKGVYLILSGKVSLTIKEKNQNEQELVYLSKGEFFGIRALLKGEISQVTATAIEDVEVALFDPDIISQMLEKMPKLALEFSQLLEMQNKAITNLKKIY